MLGGGVDAATLVAALGAGPPPPECRWGRRPHRGATACRLLERDDRGVTAHLSDQWIGALAFTRYCYDQSCMVYSITTGGRRGVGSYTAQ